MKFLFLTVLFVSVAFNQLGAQENSTTRQSCSVDIWWVGQQKVLSSFIGSDDHADPQEAQKNACRFALLSCQRRIRELEFRAYRPVECRVRDQGIKESDLPRALVSGTQNLPGGHGASELFPYIELPLQANDANGNFPYSNYEGQLSEGHDVELQNRAKTYFYELDGTFNPMRAHMALSYIKQEKEKWRSSVGGTRYIRQLEKYVVGHERAQQEALERGDYASNPEEAAINESNARVFKAFDMFINLMDSLLDSQSAKYWERLSAQQLRDEVSTALLYMTLIDTVHREHYFASDLRMLSNIFRLFYSLKKNGDDGIPHASNLVMRNSSSRQEPLRFMTQEELNELSEKGQDLSLLNPPNSAFWTNNQVESFDANDETFYGYKNLFPEEGATIKYRRMGEGGIKLMASWKDKNDVKRNIRIRVGRETHTTTLTSRLARAVGYPVIPSAYRNRIKLKLGDNPVTGEPRTYDEFVSEWLDAHGNTMGDPMSFIVQSEEDRSNGVVTLKDVCFESYPDDEQEYRRLGPFRMARNGFNNRREYRALMIFAGLIDLNDTGDTQVRADIYRDTQSNEWTPKIFLSDTGFSMGPWFIFDNMGTVNGYRDWISSSYSPFWVGDERVAIWWNHSDFHPDTWDTTKYEDAKWLVRRYLRLSEKQIEDIVRASGFPEPIVQVYKEKIKLRLHNLAEDFDLLGAPNLPQYIQNIEKIGRSDYQEQWPQQLRKKSWLANIESLRLAKEAGPNVTQRRFVDYIDEDGDINEKMINWDGTSVALNGPMLWDWEFVLVTLINAVQVQFHKYLSFEEIVGQLNGAGSFSWSSGSMSLGFLPSARGEHKIVPNSNYGAGQKRYMVMSTYTFTVPLGIINIQNFLGEEAVVKTESKDSVDDEDGLDDKDSDLSVTSPVSAQLQWTFTHYHSHETAREAALSLWDESTIPFVGWSNARERMKSAPGEAMHIKQSFLLSLGNVSGKFRDHVKFDASLVGWRESVLKELYLSIPNDNMMEVVSAANYEHELSTGVDIQAYVRLALRKNFIWGNKSYRLYRYDMNNKSLKDKNRMRLSYLNLVDKNSFLLSDTYQDSEWVGGAGVEQDYYTSTANLGFLFWGHSHMRDVRDIALRTFQWVPEQNFYAPPTPQEMMMGKTQGNLVHTINGHAEGSTKMVVTAQDLVSDGFSLFGIAADPLNAQGADKIWDYIIKVLDRGVLMDMKVEGVVKDDLSDFEEMNFVIQLNRFENWVDEEDFDKDFRKFYNARAKEGGDSTHINIKLPAEGLSLRGTMFWQLNKNAIEQLVPVLKERAQDNCMAPLLCAGHSGLRDGMESWEQKIVASMTREEKIKVLKNRAEGILEALKSYVGSFGEDLGKIRTVVKGESNMLMYTTIQNLASAKVPVALAEVEYVTRRVGQLPAQFYLRRYQYTHNIVPFLNKSVSHPLSASATSGAPLVTNPLDNLDPNQALKNIPGIGADGDAATIGGGGGDD